MYYQGIFLLCPHSVTCVISLLKLWLSLLFVLPIYVRVPILSLEDHVFPLHGPVRVINSFQITLSPCWNIDSVFNKIHLPRKREIKMNSLTRYFL